MVNAKFKEFFDSVDFRGVGFEFPKEIGSEKTNFEKEVEAYNEDKNSKNKHYSVPPLAAVTLRFFLSYPDFSLPFDKFDASDSTKNLHIKDIKNWKESFSFGQLMKRYQEVINWNDNSFEPIKNKDTQEHVRKINYKNITEKWVEKNDALRKKSKDRKKLEERCELFLKSLRGFTDWDTKGGTMKEWKDYQLKRWEAYKDLTNEDLPNSLTTLEGARKYLKEQQAKEKNGK